MLRRPTILHRIHARWRWLRHSYAFQFVHGPLCDRHRAGAVRLGHVFVCRSCLMLYTALAATTLVALLAQTPVTVLFAIWSGVALPVLVLSWPRVYQRLPRVARDGVRAGAGVLLGLVIALAVRGAWHLAVPCGIGLCVLYVCYARLRNQQRVHLCDGCPELGQDAVCSGYALQADHIRRYEDAEALRLAPAIAQQLLGRRDATKAP